MKESLNLLMMVIFLCLNVVSSRGAGEVVSVDSVVKPMTPVLKSASVLPPSFIAGVWGDQVDVRLETIDVAVLRAEDALRDGMNRTLRFGVVRELPEPVKITSNGSSSGKWDTLPNGAKVWRFVLVAPNAVGVRVLLSQVKLPEGCEIFLFDTYEPSQVCGPYSRESFGTEDSLWTATIFAERVTLEVVCPAGSVQNQIELTIDQVVYLYRDLYRTRKEGTCHNDVSCYSDWSVEALTVAGIGSVSGANYVFCTGCLLNDRDSQTYIDYFMTANHCIENQQEADSSEFYWFYKTATCNGSAPRLSNLPRTGGGADFLAGQDDAKNDFSFLKLRQASPGGVAYAGWSVSRPSATETLSSIHLPDGSFERISFGRLDSSDAYFWYIEWFSGVTEPGSSGSPLFDENHHFIGQLSGGYSSCSDTRGIDYYGRFDVSYPMIQRWLDNGSAQTQGRYLPGDYDGDGLDDLCVYYGDIGYWNIAYNNADSSLAFAKQDHFLWGNRDMAPVPADYDGDGTTDVAVYYPDGGWWLIMGHPELSYNWGWSEALPVPADYDGDGRADRAVYNPGDGYWLIWGSTKGQMAMLFGFDGAAPVPGDYDGNGRDDVGLYITASGNWQAFDIFANTFVKGYAPNDQSQWGWNGAIPVPADYDGDGAIDRAVYLSGSWYIWGSTDGDLGVKTLGGGDNEMPVPGIYRKKGRAFERSQIATYLPQSGLWQLKDIYESWSQSKAFGWADALPPGFE